MSVPVLCVHFSTEQTLLGLIFFWQRNHDMFCPSGDDERWLVRMREMGGLRSPKTEKAYRTQFPVEPEGFGAWLIARYPRVDGTLPFWYISRQFPDIMAEFRGWKRKRGAIRPVDPDPAPLKNWLQTNRPPKQ